MIPEVEARIKAGKQKVDELKTNAKKIKKEIAIAEVELAKAYEDRFPLGKFILVRSIERNHYGSKKKEDKKRNYEIWWEKGRNNLIGITTHKNNYGSLELEGFPGLYKSGQNYRYGSYGSRATKYESLEKALMAAQKFDFPLNLIEAFVKQQAGYVAKQKAIQQQKEQQRQAVAAAIEMPYNVQYNVQFGGGLGLLHGD